jgi:hypothetical protein
LVPLRHKTKAATTISLRSTKMCDLLRTRVHRFLLSQLIVRRRTTHKAQNHTYNQAVIDDYVNYTRREFAINNYQPDVVVNMDETNVDFDMVSSTIELEHPLCKVFFL